MPPPGGDVIGRRRLDPHLHAFERLGAEIEVNGRYEMRTDGLRGTQIFLSPADYVRVTQAKTGPISRAKSMV